MKKNQTRITSAIVIAMLVVTLLLLTSCSSGLEKMTKDNAIVFASFNAPVDYTSNSSNVGKLADSAKWVADNAESYGIKYISFIGRFSTQPTDTFADYNKNKLDTKLIIDKNKADTAWMQHAKSLETVFAKLNSSKIPYGVTYAIEDLYGLGGFRDSTLKDIYSTDTAIGSKVRKLVKFDDENYYSIIESNGKPYMVFQLESMPRTAVLDWFNSVMKENILTRAIVFTESLIDENGEFWKMWDWATGYPYKAEDRGNTKLKNYNVLWTDKPGDGTTAWNYAFGKWNNLLCIVTTNANCGDSIVTSIKQTEGGCDVAIIAANLTGGSNGAAPLITSVSADNKTISVAYSTNDGKYVKDSYKEIKLSNISSLDPSEYEEPLTKLAQQANGANKAYMSAKGKFDPDGAMTRGEVIEILSKLIGKAKSYKEGDSKFSNANAAVKHLESLGYLSYITSDKIDLNAKITRGEFARLLYSVSYYNEAISTEKIIDVNSEHELYNAIYSCVASGFFKLDYSFNFYPDDNLTRADFVTAINKATGLVANERTIDKSTLKNTFTDIEGHKAEYEILAATNDNILGSYHKNISTSGITEKDDSFILENDLFKVTLTKEDAFVTSVIHKPSNTQVLAANDRLITLDTNTSVYYPISVERDSNNRFKVNFKNNTFVYMIIEVQDTTMTFELDSSLPPVAYSASFVNWTNNQVISTEPDSIRISAILMSTNLTSGYHGGGYAGAIGGSVDKWVVEPMRAKYGVTVTTYADLLENTRDIADLIDEEVGVYNTRGGAYATADPKVFGDYFILSSGLSASTATQTAKLATKYSVDQIDIHQGGSTFIQADFNFVMAKQSGETFTTAAQFKERIADKIHAEGVQIGLHTYTSLIPNNATNILTNPEWQKQIEFKEVFTLQEDVSKFATGFKIVEDATGIDLPGGLKWNNTNTSYFLIDEEIVLVSKLVGTSAFTVTRGACGTTRAEHKAGAKIRHLQGWYGMFQSIPGSDLFFYIAEQTAKAYNEGDFDMIYLDGYESFTRFGSSAKNWYWYGEFARVVVSNCVKDPIIEGSAGVPAGFWNARARAGAVDSASRAYKLHAYNHAQGNLNSYHNNLYTSTLGWFHFNPDSGSQYKNMVSKTLFRDDIEYVGSIGIAYDMSIVCQPFSVSAFAAKTRLADNFGLYSIFSRLRKAEYFSPEVKEKIVKTLQETDYEYKLIRQDDGDWAFLQMYYDSNKVYDMTDDLFVSKKTNNPFKEQTPFIRIEQRYSTASTNEKVVIAFDETVEVSKHVGKHDITPTNLQSTQAFKIKVYGNNSSDALLISLRSVVTSEGGRTDFMIPLNFEGWREFIVMDSDCADYEGHTFSSAPTSGVNYETYRAHPVLTQVNSVTISLSGKCEGVKIDDLRAMPVMSGAAKNPSITVGDKTITFNTEISGGEFIEYHPDENKAYLNHYNSQGDALIEEITFTGSITVPAGEFTYTYYAEGTTAAPVRAKVVIGLSGEILENPDDWDAPEVDIPEEILKLF